MGTTLPINATKTTFDIVETLIDLNGAGSSELAAELDIPKSTVHDHLTTLYRLNYVMKDDGTYRVSTRLLKLGSELQQNYEIYNVAKPELDDLASTTGEHVSLMIEENGLGIFLYTVEGSNPVKNITVNGTATQLHTTAPGKAILAHLPDSRREKTIDKYGLPAATQNSITDYETLESHLETIRDQGYAFDKGETLEALRGVAAPIFQRNESKILGAISIYGPRRQTDVDELEEKFLSELLQIANVIEVNINY